MSRTLKRDGMSTITMPYGDPSFSPKTPENSSCLQTPDFNKQPPIFRSPSTTEISEPSYKQQTIETCDIKNNEVETAMEINTVQSKNESSEINELIESINLEPLTSEKLLEAEMLLNSVREELDALDNDYKNETNILPLTLKNDQEQDQTRKSFTIANQNLVKQVSENLEKQQTDLNCFPLPNEKPTCICKRKKKVENMKIKSSKTIVDMKPSLTSTETQTIEDSSEKTINCLQYQNVPSVNIPGSFKIQRLPNVNVYPTDRKSHLSSVYQSNVSLIEITHENKAQETNEEKQESTDKENVDMNYYLNLHRREGEDICSLSELRTNRDDSQKYENIKETSTPHNSLVSLIECFNNTNKERILKEFSNKDSEAGSSKTYSNKQIENFDSENQQLKDPKDIFDTKENISQSSLGVKDRKKDLANGQNQLMIQSTKITQKCNCHPEVCSTNEEKQESKDTEDVDMNYYLNLHRREGEDICSLSELHTNRDDSQKYDNIKETSTSHNSLVSLIECFNNTNIETILEEFSNKGNEAGSSKSYSNKQVENFDSENQQLKDDQYIFDAKESVSQNSLGVKYSKKNLANDPNQFMIQSTQTSQAYIGNPEICCKKVLKQSKDLSSDRKESMVQTDFSTEIFVRVPNNNKKIQTSMIKCEEIQVQTSGEKTLKIEEEIQTIDLCSSFPFIKEIKEIKEIQQPKKDQNLNDYNEIESSNTSIENQLDYRTNQIENSDELQTITSMFKHAIPHSTTADKHLEETLSYLREQSLEFQKAILKLLQDIVVTNTSKVHNDSICNDRYNILMDQMKNNVETQELMRQLLDVISHHFQPQISKTRQEMSEKITIATSTSGSQKQDIIVNAEMSPFGTNTKVTTSDASTYTDISKHSEDSNRTQRTNFNLSNFNLVEMQSMQPIVVKNSPLKEFTLAENIDGESKPQSLKNFNDTFNTLKIDEHVGKSEVTNEYSYEGNIDSARRETLEISRVSKLYNQGNEENKDSEKSYNDNSQTSKSSGASSIPLDFNNFDKHQNTEAVETNLNNEDNTKNPTEEQSLLVPNDYQDMVDQFVLDNLNSVNISRDFEVQQDIPLPFTCICPRRKCTTMEEASSFTSTISPVSTKSRRHKKQHQKSVHYPYERGQKCSSVMKQLTLSDGEIPKEPCNCSFGEIHVCKNRRYTMQEALRKELEDNSLILNKSIAYNHNWKAYFITRPSSSDSATSEI